MTDTTTKNPLADYAAQIAALDERTRLLAGYASRVMQERFNLEGYDNDYPLDGRDPMTEHHTEQASRALEIASRALEEAAKRNEARCRNVPVLDDATDEIITLLIVNGDDSNG